MDNVNRVIRQLAGKNGIPSDEELYDLRRILRWQLALAEEEIADRERCDADEFRYV